MSGFSLNQKDRSLQKEYLYCLEKDWRGFFVLHGERKGVMSRDSIPVWNHSHKPIAHLWCAFKKALLSCPFMFVWEYLISNDSAAASPWLYYLHKKASDRAKYTYLNLPNHSCFMYLIIKTFSIISCVILTSSTIDKIFEIFGLIFEQNASINFEPIFEKSVNFGPIFEKSVNFEHFVNGRWTHY